MKIPTAAIAPLLAASWWLPAQTVDINGAVQVEFDTTTGKFQVLEKTVDLVDWSPAAPAFFGGSPRVHQFFPADGQQTFYRVVSSDVLDLAPQLAPIRTTHNLPALGCAVVISNRIVALGVAGIRKQGVTESVTINDRWHHGSMTKSATAVLAAKLVEEGVLTWTTRLADVFPEHAGTRHPSWDTVTLEMLVTHSAGAPGNLVPSGIWAQLQNHPGTDQEQRLLETREVTRLATRYTPGTQYEYANAGYAMTGALIEKVTGRPYRDLIREKVFEPLGMATAGFGVPATPRYVDQPWGHTFSGNTPVPVAPGNTSDNPAAHAPSGGMHCSLVDYARYIAFHTAGARGEHPLLQPATFEKLYTPVHSNYAMGWLSLDRPWGKGRVLTHTGSNNMWLTTVWIAPNRHWAVVVVTNSAGDPATTASSQVVNAMIAQYLP
ncbi:MAG: beta-lactamase family protein [Verrucomicrobia bacterium]|nr:beta-lactamase family protein [Verrucomicrobiota bacterium]